MSYSRWKSGKSIFEIFSCQIGFLHETARICRVGVRLCVLMLFALVLRHWSRQFYTVEITAREADMCGQFTSYTYKGWPRY